MVFLIYNPLANSNHGEETKNSIKVELEEKYGQMREISVIGLDPKAFIDSLKESDKVVIVGGDGTLMHFANEVAGLELPCKFFLYKAGTGNDFLNDVKDKIDNNMIEINEYVKDLPIVYIDDKQYRFLNGIGYGLDGTACEVADKQRAAGKTKINYTSISINLLLFKYKCPSADVTVDGIKKHYKKVWLCSGMNGKYYGGGMMIAPEQDRLSNTLTSVVFHDSGRIKTLMVFPKIFKGEHTKYTKMVDIRTGHDITVEFSKPNALQIDGETFLNVKKYRIVKK